MQLNGVYDFKELSHTDGVDVWKAVEKSSGQQVQIHLFPVAKQQAANDICERLIGLPSDARSKVRQFGAVGDVTCFVTDVLAEGETLQKWIGRQTGPTAAASTPATPETMRVNVRKVDMGPAFSPFPHGGGAPPGPPPPPASRTPDASFTQLYSKPAPTPPPPASKPPEGSFTQLYSDQDLKSTLDRAKASQAPSRPIVPEPQSAPDSFSAVYSKLPQTREVDFRRPEPEPEPQRTPEPAARPGSLTEFLNIDNIPKRAEPERIPEPPAPVEMRPPTPLPPPRPAPVSELPPVPAPSPQEFFLPPRPQPVADPYAASRVKPIVSAPSPYSPPPGIAPPRSAPPPAPYVPAASASPLLEWRTVMWVVLILVVVLGVVIGIVEATG